VATHGVFSPLPEVPQTFDTTLIPLAQSAMLVSHARRVTEPDPMLCAGLVFAGTNRGAGESRPAIVTAREIAGIDLRGTQLVVLSACETGVGHLAGGTEFAGLRRALAIAGAATQVTSLWKVDDDATRALMAHYYRALAAGTDRVEALVLAQQRTANDPAHPQRAHPFYWAAFISAGATGPVDLT
jgi:CHAT domain-containing protein